MSRPPFYDEEVARFNLRLPQRLYDDVRRLARAERLSVNQWMVRALQAEAERLQRADAQESTHS